MKMSRFTPAAASRFLGPKAASEGEHLQSDVCIGMEIVADGAV